MAEIAKHSLPDGAVARAAERAMDWLITHHSICVNGQRCVCEHDYTAKLGGAGLGILACLAVYHLNGRERFLQYATEFGDFTLGMQRADGDFHHKSNLRTGGKESFRSGYYTGEALFGLNQLYFNTGKQRFADASRRSIAALSAQWYGAKEHSHWMLYALSTAVPIVGRQTALDYASVIAERIVSEPAYRDRRKSTPIACRSEGLLAFLALSRVSETGELQSLRDKAWVAAWDNLCIQKKWFDTFGTFVAGDHSDWVRIDYIQHNASSFFYAARLIEDGGI